MATPEVSLVIPTVYPDQWQWFWERNHNQLNQAEVIVVASFPRPSQLPNSVTWLQLPEPQGFAKTVNKGFAAATAPFVGTCNDDVVLSENWQMLLKVFQDPTVGGVNPVIVNPAGEIETAGIDVLPIGKAKPLLTIPSSKTYSTQALNGACVVFTKKLLAKTRGFDESFGSYLEDIDLSLRGRKRGFMLVVDPNVTVVHHKHQTTQTLLGKRKKAWLDMRNWWKIILRHSTSADWKEQGVQIVLERMRNLSGWLKTWF